MAISEWGIACIVISVMLCVMGICLCFRGVTVYRRTAEQREEYYARQREERRTVREQVHPLHMLQREQEAQQREWREEELRRVEQQQQAQERQAAVGTFLADPPPRAHANDWDPQNAIAEAEEEERKLQDEIAHLEEQRQQLAQEWEGKVVVREFIGDSHEVEVRSTDTVALLKDKLFDITTIIPQNLRVIYAGRELTPDYKTLQELQIPQNAILHLLTKASYDPNGQEMAVPVDGEAEVAKDAHQAPEAGDVNTSVNGAPAAAEGTAAVGHAAAHGEGAGVAYAPHQQPQQQQPQHQYAAAAPQDTTVEVGYA